MKKLALLMLAALLLAATSCEKIELPADEDGSKEETPAPTPEQPGTDPDDEPDDSADENDPTGGADIWSVAQALTLGEDEFVWVKGYIVGYARSTSRSSLTFARPTEKPNTNMFIADRPEETDKERCMAIRLAQSGMDYRSKLNMFDHPEFFRQPILIMGQTGTYFGATGIREIFEYVFLPTEQMGRRKACKTGPEEKNQKKSP